jgi:transcriptional regulator
MYQPDHFREDRPEVQHELIRRHPLGLLVSCGPAGLIANPVPFLLAASEGERGVLRCHLARANPQWRELMAAPQCLVVFQGPDHYVSPSWYATKKEHGKVVPTWNYATVHCSGRAVIKDDASWLAVQIDALTRLQEGRRAVPWAVADAPPPFIAAQLRGIVGIEIPIDRIEGKWKVSQNRTEADRQGVVSGLQSEGETAAAMVALVRDHARPDNA